MQQIAILGAGAMGSRLADNLLEAGYPVTVYNRTQARTEPLVAKGATYATTPRAAAEGAKVVISMVRDDGASRQVWLTEEAGAAHGLGEGAIAIEASTLTVSFIQDLAQAVKHHGKPFLTVPVVGSRPQAEANCLIGLAGGDLDVLDQVQATLNSAGITTLYPVGSAAQAMTLKLAVNVLFGTQVAALAEMLTMLTQSGLLAEQAMALLSKLPITPPPCREQAG